MKKKMMVALLGVMLSATAAHAEHKLLVTDVLEPKQIEGQALFEYSHLSGDIRSEEGSGTVRNEATESTYSLGVGLGHGLEMSAYIPYVFNERGRRQITGLEPEYEKGDGVGDFAVEAKYLLLGGEEEKYAVVTGLDLKFDTAGRKNAGTGTTDVAPFIAASTRLGHHYTPYAIYRANIRNHEVQDTHTLSLGVEKELNHTFTIDAKIDANFNTTGQDINRDRVSANEDYVFEVASYVQVAHNFYVIPSVAYLLSSDFDRSEEAGNVHFASADGVRAGLSLYYLY